MYKIFLYNKDKRRINKEAKAYEFYKDAEAN